MKRLREAGAAAEEEGDAAPPKKARVAADNDVIDVDAYEDGASGGMGRPRPGMFLATPDTSWAAIEARFVDDPNVLNRGPRDDDIVFNDDFCDASQTRRNHFYMFRGRVMATSVTGAASHFKSAFDLEAAISNVKRAATKPGYHGPYIDKSEAAVRASMTGANVLGTDRHKLYERVLCGQRLADEEKERVPLGFRRFLADHPRQVPHRVEWLLADEKASIGGAADCAMKRGIFIDWKNFRYMTAVMGPRTERAFLDAGVLAAPRYFSGTELEARMQAEETTYREQAARMRAEEAAARIAWDQQMRLVPDGLRRPRPEDAAGVDIETRIAARLGRRQHYHDPAKDRVPAKCPHPLLDDVPDGKLTSAWLQLNIYADMAERSDPAYVASEGPFRELWLVNFPPEFPDHYELFRLKRMPPALVRRIFDLFPWRPRDERHFARNPATELLVPLVGPDDERGQKGPTRAMRVQKGPVPAGTCVWVGFKYEKNGYTLGTSPWAMRRRPNVSAAVRAHIDSMRSRPMGQQQQRPRIEPELRRALDDYKKVLQEAALAYERELVTSREKLGMLVAQLYGRVLLCWCDGEIDGPFCHARILARYANALGSGAIAIAPVPRGPMDAYVERSSSSSSSSEAETPVPAVAAADPTSSPFRV